MLTSSWNIRFGKNPPRQAIDVSISAKDRSRFRAAREFSAAGAITTIHFCRAFRRINSRFNLFLSPSRIGLIGPIRPILEKKCRAQGMAALVQSSLYSAERSSAMSRL